MNEKVLPLSKEKAARKYIQEDSTKVIEYINAEIEKQMNPYDVFPRATVYETQEFRMKDFRRVKPMYENVGWRVHLSYSNVEESPIGYMELT